MEEKNIKNESIKDDKSFTPLVSEEVFKDRLTEFKNGIEEYKNREQEKIDEFTKNGTLCLTDFSGVKKFKSIRRAIRRGHVSIYGQIYPHRPFKNTKNNRYKRIIYGQLKHKATIE